MGQIFISILSESSKKKTNKKNNNNSILLAVDIYSRNGSLLSTTLKASEREPQLLPF